MLILFRPKIYRRETKLKANLLLALNDIASVKR